MQLQPEYQEKSSYMGAIRLLYSENQGRSCSFLWWGYRNILAVILFHGLHGPVLSY